MKNRKPQSEGETSLLIWKIPKPLKQSFKATTAEKGETMRDVIIRMMKDYCNRA